MALIQCPDCGRMVSERAARCPQCGMPIADMKRILQEQAAQIARQNAEFEQQQRIQLAQIEAENKRIAEQERLRIEAENKRIAEQERLRMEAARERAEKRAEWWKKNGKKVYIIIGIILLLAAGVAAWIWISDKKAAEREKQAQECAAQQAISQANKYIAQGDSCVAIYHFDEAREYYTLAYERTEDIEVRNSVRIHRNQLANAEQEATMEYNDALRKLRIYLDADDNEFYENSNACLDKMIAIDPYNELTIYYKNLRGR